ncbi:helix-turn-helix domain-containing protein [Streptomyces sp. NPDC093260]|uniref:AraC-like ligand-binding domain-containing protein n=1 Tax=Streptomyces sp. NPDC093260 TaxID=3155073 RepID=UPI003419DF74
MLTTVLDTAHLPPADRAAAWGETTGQALMTTRVRFLDPDRVEARIQTMALGPVQLSVMSYTPLSSRRTPRLIRQSDPEMYQLALTLAGQQSIEQARAYASLNPGDLLLYDSSRSFTATAGPKPPGARAMLLQFPRHLLPLPENAVAPLCGTALDGRAGIGRLLHQLLTGLADTHADLTSADSTRLGTTALDLTAALIAHHTDRQSLLPAGSRQRAMFEQISAYITTHLHEPDLTPGAVAAAHFISTRYLHRIFQQHGTTVSDAVRQQRLARCRRDLADPSQRTVPIAVIAMRWGYPRPSDFTRAFRAALGMTPSEYRAASQDPDRAQRQPHRGRGQRD